MHKKIGNKLTDDFFLFSMDEYIGIRGQTPTPPPQRKKKRQELITYQ